MESNKKRILFGVLAPAVWILFGLAGGIMMAKRVPFPPGILLIVGTVISFPLLLGAFAVGEKSGRQRARTVALCFVAAVVGFLISSYIYRIALGLFFRV